MRKPGDLERGAVGLPVVDLSMAEDRAGAQRVAREIDEACRGDGVLRITGHGIDRALVDRMEAVSRRFFELPDDVKQRCVSPSGDPYRAWAVSEAVTGDGPVRLHEQFEVSWFDSAGELAAAGYSEEWVERAEANVWPSDPPELESTWRSYFEAATELSGRLLRLMALALDLPEEWFVERHTRHASYLACNLYHPVDPRLGRDLRLAEHTDLGTLTIVHLDDGPGPLQVRDASGHWRDVRAIEDTFVVHLGDLMAMWTGGRWRATEHRVIAAADGDHRPRLSIPCFVHPDLDAVIDVVPGGAGSDASPRDPVVAGEWVLARMADSGRAR